MATTPWQSAPTTEPLQLNLTSMGHGTTGLVGLQGILDLAIENLAKAISINPEWQEYAKTDRDFDAIREQPGFQGLTFSQGVAS